MALVTKLERVTKERHSVHGPVECAVSSFDSAGQRYLQLDTFGSAQRRNRGEMNQSIQLSADAAQELRRIIDEVFGR